MYVLVYLYREFKLAPKRTNQDVPLIALEAWDAKLVSVNFFRTDG